MFRIKGLNLCIFLFICILVPVRDIRSQSAEELYQKAIQLEEIKGELEKAISIYSSVIEKYPSNKSIAALSELHLGLCYDKLGKEYADRAVLSFRKVIEKYPDQNMAVRMAKEKLTAYSTDDSEIEQIKITLSEFNRAFESKDADKYAGYYSVQSFSRGGDTTELIKWKEHLRMQFFSVWKTISITSSISSIVKTGNNYVVSEQWKMSALDWQDNVKDPLYEEDRIITFIKENREWKILNVRVISLPVNYKTLNSKYSAPGRPGLIYTSHITQNFVSVIDPVSNSLIGVIPSGYGTVSIAFSPDNEKGYIANFNSNDLIIFNKKTNERIAAVPVGVQPTYIEFTPDGEYILITHQSSDGTWILSAKDNQAIKKLPGITGIPIYNSSNGKIYISGIFQPYVWVFDTSSLANEKSILTGGRPMDPALSSDGRYLYISNYDLKEVEKIDTKTDSVISRIKIRDNPRGIALSADDKYAYVCNVVTNKVSVVDIMNEIELKQIEVGKMPTTISMNREGSYAYVSNQGEATVSVIDVKTNQVIQTIQVADNPISVMIDEKVFDSMK